MFQGVPKQSEVSDASGLLGTRAVAHLYYAAETQKRSQRLSLVVEVTNPFVTLLNRLARDDTCDAN